MMYPRPYWSPDQKVDKPPLLSGIASGCPFCLSRQNHTPLPGERLLFLTSFDSGQFGTCIEDKYGSVRLDQFLVKMDYEIQENRARVVTRSDELFLIEPVADSPNWMLPLSIEDALSVHENMLFGLDRASKTSTDSYLVELCYPIASGCWLRRLPLSADEVWLMLEAHDVHQDTKKDFVRLFDFGTEILVRTQGRPAIKRKRMQPLSRGKYLSKAQQKIRIDYFGHD